MEVNDGKMRQTNKDGNNIFDEKIQTENIKDKCTKEDDKDKPLCRKTMDKVNMNV